ncbi:MAG: hypothetical protein RLZZ241_696 [Bacteroidota bacterium]
MKKSLVLIVLFVLPLVVYLFFASGVTNFGRLPILSGPVSELSAFNSGIQLKDRITVLGFLGSDLRNRKGNVFNLNQKIYKPYFEFHDFQMVMVSPLGTEQQADEIIKELSNFTDTKNWHFIFGDQQQIALFFKGLNTDLTLDATGGTPYVFIVDKDLMLRGRTDDEDQGTKYGFDATAVADLNNKMKDDIKIILAEYRLALKKNNNTR